MTSNNVRMYFFYVSLIEVKKNKYYHVYTLATARECTIQVISVTKINNFIL